MPASSGKKPSATATSAEKMIKDFYDGVIPDEPRSKIGDPKLDNAMERLLPTARHHQQQLQRQQDYSKARPFKNAALYMPAVSSTFADALAKLKLPSHMNFTPDDLQFTNPNSDLCFYPWVLYSAGQAAKTPKLAEKSNWLSGGVHDPRVVLIADSGGFQIQNDKIDFLWPETVERMLRWQERVATHSMVLDFPLATISSGGVAKHVERLKQDGIELDDLSKSLGFDTGFLACLFQTVRNNRYYRWHRKTGTTKILNIIQGRNERESKFWFVRMKQFHFDGWTFAGKHHSELAMTCRRLIELRDLGLLGPGQWLHFLGVSTMRVGAGLSFLQRALRKHTDATDIQLSFDSGSPVDAVVNGYKAIAGFDIDPNRWRFIEKRTRIPELIGDKRPLQDMLRAVAAKGDEIKLVRTALGANLTIDDMATQQFEGFTPAQTRYLQQVLLIHHNTQAYFEAFRQVYKTLDDKGILKRPMEIRHLPFLLDDVFTSETPMDFINKVELELNAQALAKA